MKQIPVEIMKKLYEGNITQEEWREHVYQGDDMRQFTPRAVIMGGLLGLVMSISNLYTTLKLGWGFGVAITACVLSYVIWNLLFAAKIVKTKMSILENNCMQSTASAAGYSTGGTIATAIGALLLISGDEGRLGWVTVAIWTFLVAVLGVLLAIPMKRQMINVEQLKFPSGIAAAETLRNLYAEGRAALLKTRALIGAMGAGIGLALLRIFEFVKEEIQFGLQVFTVRGTTFTSNQLYGFVFEPSLLLVAAGMIMGLQVSLSMLAGALINYLVVTPYIMGLDNWAREGVNYFGHMEVVLGDGGVVETVKVTRWSLWFGTTVMVMGGLTAFALGWRTIVRAFSGFGKKNNQADEFEARMMCKSTNIIDTFYL